MSTSPPAGSPASTWPFWAPSQKDAVDTALALAEVGPGVRLLDLGCGDGQVLLAAARLGADVAGIEADDDLVAEARAHLADAGVDADVRAGDLFDPELVIDADVLFAYLAPATLQRLLPRLRQLRATVLVTVDFDVPGLVPDRRDPPAQRYRLPGRRRRVGRPGWPSAGTLVATVPDVQSLTCLELVHPGGPTGVRLSGSLRRAATALAGADHLDEPAHLAVDIRWEGLPADTVVGGVVRANGVDDHGLYVVFCDDEEAVWELDAGATDELRRALRRRRPPTTLTEVLALVGA